MKNLIDRMGLLRLVLYFCVLWTGIIFMFLGLNAFLTFNLTEGSNKFYLSLIVEFCGIFLVVVGSSLIVGEVKQSIKT